ncbi:MAG: TIGR04282 family arsenosugar biosynthesis glycosyltransferase, partial [Desulfobacteraceae bacterium]|nr:TIGR04282 family arsenosugar biosynthesis glycosyltransferase [Desulfobacteraceae bacterium]
MPGVEAIAKSRLIVLTRYPAPGRAKTRLIPALGADGAAEFQRRMTERVLGQVEALVARRAHSVRDAGVTVSGDPAHTPAARQPVSVEVRFEGGDPERMIQWLGPQWTYRSQGEGDIGARMAGALAAAFAEGSATAVLIGTDIPDLSTVILAEAFQRLADHDIVIGPAADGGYYLIGVRRERFAELAPRLFQGIAWGTENVLRDTLS